jgi:hypothetical protein
MKRRPALSSGEGENPRDMALIKRKECGKDDSDTVPACPHCGLKRPKQAGKLVTIFVVLIAVVWVGMPQVETVHVSGAQIPPR